MSEKQDYYEVLGISKNATAEEISKAFKQIALKCHPNMLRNKTAEEKAEAHTKFLNAKEASEVLGDAVKCKRYDQYGHSGISDLKKGSRADTATPETIHMPVRREMPTTEDVFSYFDKAAQQRVDRPVMATGETAEQRRQRNAEERRRARESARVKSPITDHFQEVAGTVAETAEKLKAVELPLDVLLQFRDNLQDFMQQVDAAIERSRKSAVTPKPK